MRAHGTTRPADVRRYAYLDTRVSGMSVHLLGTADVDRLLEHPGERGAPATGKGMTSALQMRLLRERR